MLGNTPVMTMLPVVDMGRARAFYADTLGLKSLGPNPQGNQLFSAGGATIALYQREAPTRADHTALSWEVKNIGAVIRALTDRGVVFEDYDLPGLKTVDKVCVLGAEKAAWFKDPEGNILCLHENL
jgi:catechol 2,3-dioxygenase-like lactoylglutathione lyase family enzyme